MDNKQKDIFFTQLSSLIDSKELIRLLINNRRDKSSELQSIIVTIAELKRGFRLNFVYRHKTKDITKNYEFTEGIEIIKKALENDFLNAEIFAKNEDIKLITNTDGKIKLITNTASMQALTAFSHDKVKGRLINTVNNIYLRELGITNSNWEIRRESSDKFKQINRYIELLEPEIKEMFKTDTSSNTQYPIPNSQYPIRNTQDPIPNTQYDLHVADMGSGKGYLTFAFYDYLSNISGKTIKMTGVESREELVELCNSIAQKAAFKNLNFIKGEIENAELDKIDILIALHACDTATDDAIYRGIKSDASLIVLSPCCHKQIRKEMKVEGELANIVKHGILKERQAEIITDSLRALIMEAFGYRTRVIEFISSEHTSKNLMIIGRRVMDVNPDKATILKEIDSIKKIYGINKHYLEVLLGI